MSAALEISTDAPVKGDASIKLAGTSGPPQDNSFSGGALLSGDTGGSEPSPLEDDHDQEYGAFGPDDKLRRPERRQ